jgi:hypothetical protein
MKPLNKVHGKHLTFEEDNLKDGFTNKRIHSPGTCSNLPLEYVGFREKDEVRVG